MANPTVKVAVLGSGLAGLTAAYLLTKVPQNDETQYEVHVFEKAPSLGMDAYSVSLSTGDEDFRVDVPMRSFQGGYYPRLLKLYKELGVSFKKSDFSYSFSFAAPTRAGCHTIVTNMIYNGSSGMRGVSLPSVLKAQYQQVKETVPRLALQYSAIALFVLATMQLLLNYVRLLVMAAPLFRSSQVPHMTFCQWARHTAPSGSLARFTSADSAWIEFLTSVVLPLFSAVCTASEADIMQHPVEEILDYIWLTIFTHHYVVTNGVCDVVRRLSASMEHVHVSSPISDIMPDPANPRLISLQCIDARGTAHTYNGFSHIIFATQANHAAELLSCYLSNLPPDSPQSHFVRDQIQCLQSFTYRPSIVINHTDESLLPEDPHDRRDLNLVCLSDTARHTKSRDQNSEGSICVSPSYTMATHSLREPGSSRVVYQTTNPIVSPRKDSILSIARMERAVLTLDAKKALRDLYVPPSQSSRQKHQRAALSSGTLGRLQGMPEEQRTWPQNRRPPGIWFCGSYAYQGIPLLEGCVVSAANVVEQGISAQQAET
ncbi:FAD/NAD(P)-binding domain-containing protein [Heliocybe sulcata]|uniref:FAD/NAD(P)-binding domain-containing protein n=1 Tax=Heliocybe sulcata TaxID=5364 RepID=A0A5C3NMG8_9AGAM|nr:FAD/NAD(P)-binding domain-containing protein [Heliocybe sulcata]